MASSLFLTERNDDAYEFLYQADGETPINPPKYKGRIETTLHKAKEVRSFVEKCITLGKKVVQFEKDAEQYATDQERNSDGWKQWRNGEQWQKWVNAQAPAVNARRRLVAMLDNKEAVNTLVDMIAPRFLDRPGGYTRVLKLAERRLGDAGARAILELVGQNDRVKSASAEAPAFETEEAPASEEVEASTSEE